MQAHKQTKTGIAISRSGIGTIIVKVDTFMAHPLYKKKVRKTKRFAAHDASDEATVGDTVTIEETRPQSKTKRWKVTKVVKQSKVEV